MPSPPDREISPLEIINPATPLGPQNVICSSGFLPETFDIRWSPPSDLSNNSGFNVVGVNVYRSSDSPSGPWIRLNSIPLGTTFYRDKTRIAIAMQEDISNSFIIQGTTDSNAKWIFRTQNRPLYLDPTTNLIPDQTNLNMFVTVDGVQAYVERINLPLGEVELRNYPVFDVVSQKLIPPVLPQPGSVVLATYKYEENQINTSLSARIFYQITTVAYDTTTGELLETPLQTNAAVSNNSVEQLDYIWKEAIRRNKFILFQGGERCKAFLRKSMGTRCGCYSESNKQPSATCEVCFATGFFGGYDGPYDVIIAPDDHERNVQQSNRGRSFTHTQETWTGPSPQLSQRDFIVKLNGDRYGIGPVRSPSVRNTRLQQHFTVSHLDEGDIRYKVQVFDTTRLVAPQTRYLVPGQGDATPMLTDNTNVIPEQQVRMNSAAAVNLYRR